MNIAHIKCNVPLGKHSTQGTHNAYTCVLPFKCNVPINSKTLSFAH